MVPHPRPWLDAWVESAHGDCGFWLRERPADHFRTASSTSALLASAVADLLGDHPEITCVVELGAGAGQLLSVLSSVRPDLALAGVDVRRRPASLPHRVGWHEDLWDVTTSSWSWGPAERLLGTLEGPTLLLAVEWLDDLPCPVAARTDDCLSVVEVEEDGQERLGQPLGQVGRAWADRWWPYGPRLEIGTTRDLAWSAALSHVSRMGGLALAIDYGHLIDARPGAGSIAAYRSGRQVTPRPDPDLNLTAAVAFDSLAEAGVAAGASTLLLTRQHEVLSGTPLPREPDPVADLAARSQLAALTNPAVWGNQLWLLQSVVAVPPVVD